MDYRLAVLLHVPLGLKVSSKELALLTAAELDVENISAVEAALTNPTSRAYLWQHPDWLERSKHILAESEKHSIYWLCLGQQGYPQLWTELSRRPALFSYQGDVSVLQSPLLAVVGSRTPSTDTLLWLQRELAAFLKKCKVGTVSGGARGVDQWAHRLAMDCGERTVCILPSGLLKPFPFANEKMWQRIVTEGGAMVSTCGLFEPMCRDFFHTRNRWIAGLSSLCFVAEANRRSGSILTAGLARDEGRTLCTLPVFPTAAQGLGNLDLIEEGAFFLRDQYDLRVLWDRLNCAQAAP